MKSPWTLTELAAMRDSMIKKVERVEKERPNARPLPPMTVEESEELIHGFLDIAVERPLTLDETFLIGQLLSCFKQAVQAETLGCKGRYFVVNEEDLKQFQVGRG